ncbi:hypothetical protein HMPREF0322_05143 [Desulfitobacterium hafniense DP7]|uniref:Uncharacterized protein n=1 Tax=Desulfitobacterium hafniense DP7 TaxID=537010 RepID=G9XVW0_DESHA|nr:TylF/MycF/NovP-related O-methyltransferase [Desulfitobacterium hafniense]EHL04223.1 hypothetical protein HMPREF0322_05143 [Desulfitobacterium hafniense DP7]
MKLKEWLKKIFPMPAASLHKRMDIVQEQINMLRVVEEKQNKRWISIVEQQESFMEQQENFRKRQDDFFVLQESFRKQQGEFFVLQEGFRKQQDEVLKSQAQKLLTCDLRPVSEKVLIENLENPTYFHWEQKIHNSLCRYENYHFPAAFYSRITIEDINNKIKSFTDRFNKKCVVLTDTGFKIKNAETACIEDIPKYRGADIFFLLAFNFDWNARRAVEMLSQYSLPYLPGGRELPLAKYYHIDKNAFDTLLEESVSGPKAHFCPPDFANIFQALYVTRDLPGDYMEIGAFQGSSARAALNYMNRAGIRRKSYFLDTYEGFAYEEARDSMDALWQDGHTDTSVSGVREYLSDYNNYELVKANIIRDTLPEGIKQIAVCNVDVDMYEAVAAALERVKGLIVPGGIIIAEDFGHTPALIGAQKATIDFISAHRDSFIPLYLESGQMFLIKR